ncbi:MAG: lipolytic enzyme [Nocardia sp.]|uniref:SGNH/GDSL hydrolase family protein n=1 Tax=Nocardia sp. TaxID=1821 RepID=UPI00261D957E|nr:SGNH/GDSL hydrolase family protein [Nocardia sp.]MCU1640306.1 lipolytic enzyme [Nocardia sp.]
MADVTGTYFRYVALGDSQTEGVGDGDDATGLRGWADRLAGQLATENPELLYANLAVRGRLAHQVHEQQLPAALALNPDIATVVAGANDILRPGCDLEVVVGHLESMFAALTAHGTVVATLTFPDLSRITPLARPVRHRIVELNERIRAAARPHGVYVAEIAGHDAALDPRQWSSDRLHCSSLGHQRIADAMAEALGLPGSDDAWTRPLPPGPRVDSLRAVTTELRWAAGFLGPWLGRRVLGRSSGDGRLPKRPALSPVAPLQVRK